MKFRSVHLIKPDDLNSHDTLFGGRLLSWLDEEAAVWVMSKLGINSIVTKYVSEVDFMAPALKGDLIEIGCDLVAVGKSSITVECLVRNITTKKEICKINKIVFVVVDPITQKRSHHNHTLHGLELRADIME